MAHRVHSFIKPCPTTPNIRNRLCVTVSGYFVTMATEGIATLRDDEPVILNGQLCKENPEIPKVVVESAENSSSFASSVLKVLSMQRFYSNSGRMPRDTWLEKYTYRR
ncbi:predicted protein [Nematostella vectensis]|uniref:Uncharacterized protein n=1 Tax=Nematostella vectensis TaxID=45351 RepID=A7T1M2_NEMVE|nr:predicted protein [Nematostella vectensis]|eukprot:XP_001622245.1 predicted protein [Nematostella vectensis]